MISISISNKCYNFDKENCCLRTANCLHPTTTLLSCTLKTKKISLQWKWIWNIKSYTVHEIDPRTHFTKGLWAQDWNLARILYDIIIIVVTSQGEKFAPVMAALLLYHVQNCDLIRSLFAKLEQHEIWITGPQTLCKMGPRYQVSSEHDGLQVECTHLMGYQEILNVCIENYTAIYLQKMQMACLHGNCFN